MAGNEGYVSCHTLNPRDLEIWQIPESEGFKDLADLLSNQGCGRIDAIDQNTGVAAWLLQAGDIDDQSVSCTHKYPNKAVDIVAWYLIYLQAVASRRIRASRANGSRTLYYYRFHLLGAAHDAVSVSSAPTKA